MPHFAARQHDSLRAATGRRHHLNLLLHDYDEVINPASTRYITRSAILPITRTSHARQFDPNAGEHSHIRWPQSRSSIWQQVSRSRVSGKSLSDLGYHLPVLSFFVVITFVVIINCSQASSASFQAADNSFRYTKPFVHIRLYICI